jgi:hypothetical protein
MWYLRFYLAARRYAKHKITRGEFCADWEHAQRLEGIEAKKQNGPKRTAKQCQT